jgi:hypothetical protein
MLAGRGRKRRQPIGSTVGNLYKIGTYGQSIFRTRSTVLADYCHDRCAPAGPGRTQAVVRGRIAGFYYRRNITQYVPKKSWPSPPWQGSRQSLSGRYTSWYNLIRTFWYILVHFIGHSNQRFSTRLVAGILSHLRHETILNT